MTGAHDKMAFASALKDLAAAYGKAMSQDMSESYWDGLEDLDLSTVRAGMRLAKRDARYMPSVAVIREAARLAQQQDGPQQAMSRPQLEDGEVWCKTCDDTGWVSVERLVPPNTSPHYQPGATRIYASPCGCRTDNPMYQWARQQERRQGARPEGR